MTPRYPCAGAPRCVELHSEQLCSTTRSQETLSRRKSSFASDVYMFGAFMFETLADSKPFADVSQIDRVEELVKAGTKPVRPPGALGSAATWALVDKCMAFEEAARPALDHVIRELDKLIAAADLVCT
jgi:hypothetical protein